MNGRQIIRENADIRRWIFNQNQKELKILGTMLKSNREQANWDLLLPNWFAEKLLSS